MTRAVVDPSVLVSSFIGRADAAPGRLVAAWRAARFMLVVSPALLGELDEVLRRPKFERWAAEGRAGAYVAGLAARSERHDDPDRPDPSGLRDPDDEYLVALARRAGVETIVFLDLDLLEAPLPELAMVSPADFLRRLDTGSQSDF